MTTESTKFETIGRLHVVHIRTMEATDVEGYTTSQTSFGYMLTSEGNMPFLFADVS